MCVEKCLQQRMVGPPGSASPDGPDAGGELHGHLGRDATSWLWDFGGGATSTLANPEHVYTAVGLYTVPHDGTSTEANPVHLYRRPGVYSVRLTVENAGGLDTLTRLDLVSVHARIRSQLLPPGAFLPGIF